LSSLLVLELFELPKDIVFTCVILAIFIFFDFLRVQHSGCLYFVLAIFKAKALALPANETTDIAIRAVDDILLLIILIDIFNVDIHFVKVELLKNVQICCWVKLFLVVLLFGIGRILYLFLKICLRFVI
jgi:hypothetical protein